MDGEELKFCPICSGVGEEVISEILSFAKKVSYAEGQYIYMQGDPCDGIYFILEGEVRLTAQNEKGKEFFIKKPSSGEILGETGILTNHCLESAMAMTTTTCIFLPQVEFSDLISRNAHLSSSLVSMLGGWIVDFYDRFQTLSITNVRERVEHFFANEVKETKNSNIRLKLKRHEMASNLGIRPETLSRILTDLQREGLIKIENNVVDLSNFKALTR